jgi:hypothetical protein
MGSRSTRNGSTLSQIQGSRKDLNMNAAMVDVSVPKRSLMKALKRFSRLALSGLILLMSVRPLHAQPPAPPNTTDILVMMNAKPGVQREQISKLAPLEVRATVRLYLDGKIRQWFQRTDGGGVVFIVAVKTAAEAKAIMETLPLAQANLVDHEYIALSPLGPLGTLLGPPPAGK